MAIFRLPDYRVCFLSKLQGLIKNTVLPTPCAESQTMCSSAPSFIDKYLVPSDSAIDPTESSGSVVSEAPISHDEPTVVVSRFTSETSESLNLVEEDLPSTASESHQELSTLDLKGSRFLSLLYSHRRHHSTGVRDPLRSDHLP